MVALRFALLAIPTILFVPRPQVPLRWLIGIGLGIGHVQFAFLYLGMAAGMPSGLASLVLQASRSVHGADRRRLAARAADAPAGRSASRRGAGLAVIAVHRAQVAARCRCC